MNRTIRVGIAVTLICGSSRQVPAEPIKAAGPSKSEETQAHANGSFDSDARPDLTERLTDDLTIGAKINIEMQVEDNQDADPDKTDTLLLLNPKVSIGALYEPSDEFEIFGEIRIDHENPLQDTADDRDKDTTVEFREGYVLLKDLLAEGLSLQVGRQRFKDAREWFFDDRLDAVRIGYKQGPFSLELSTSSKVIDPEDKEDETVNYILEATYGYSKKGKIAFYGINRQDDTAKDRDPLFFGLSWTDRPNKQDKFWLDSAVLLGQDRDKDLSAAGFDVGWSHRFEHDLKPNITFGYAFGSGDSDPKDDTDRAFQQTDLQDNNGKFWGVTKFKYYGEVLDPELSNMMIFTAGIGVVPSKRFSLDLVYHYYRLIEPTDELRDAGIEEDLAGTSKDLGQELDMVLGLRPADDVSASVSAGVFFPGQAYENDSAIFGAKLVVQVSF